MGALAACSAYDGGLLRTDDSQTRSAVGSMSNGPDAGSTEGGAPQPMSMASGEACSGDAECLSGHCVDDRCCAPGLCCNEAADCPGDLELGMACDDAPNCQGTRGALQCQEQRCVTNDGEPDDRACSEAVMAADCDAYRPIFCTGEADQEPPSCPTSCARDSECDDDAHCRDGACVTDAANGAACERDKECASAHCDAALCCAGEDCCADASDCPSRYSSPAACDDPEQCQGTRTEATCVDFSCGSEPVADDSACDASVSAAGCGRSIDLFCSGGEDQTPPECSSDSCGDDADCDGDAYCGSGSACSADRADGAECSRDAQCESDHCNGGHCCRDGDCCADDDDCDNRYVCTDPRECRGQVYRQSCSEAFRCEEAPEPEASSYGCVGQVARECDAPGYRDVICYLLPTPYVRECSVCESDAECTRDYECRNGECQLQRDDGGGEADADPE
jgi:hypothetical protein